MINIEAYKPHVVLVDDELSELEAYSFLLESMGVQNITTIDDSRKVMESLKNIPSPIVFLDLNMPKVSGLEVLQEIKAKQPQIPVIICTASSEIETAVKCLKLGAHDYLVKPINLNTFGSALRTAVEIVSLRNEVLSLKGISFRDPVPKHAAFDDIITQNCLMTEIFNYIEAIAPSGQPILILGETGTGKELLARAIHQISPLSGEFVAVDVSGLDDALFSDTLFGHGKGAYTGANRVRPGLIEQAKEGTIFLDEIGDLPEVSQMKLLRLLQEGVYYPLGSDKPKQCRARIITATNKTLTNTPGENKNFRKDLYYRLSTHLIKVPPLKERKDDISLLVEQLINEAAASMKRHPPQISKKALQLLENYNFPGNIRELKTYLYDAVARTSTDIIADWIIEERLNISATASPLDKIESKPLEHIFGKIPTLDELVEFAIDQALKQTGNNQSQAARLLGLSKQALNKRVKKRQQNKTLIDRLVN